LAVGVKQVPALLNWAGSKAVVARTLINLGLPAFERYHEPFLGSGAAALAFSAAGKIGEAHLSDLNPLIVNLFKSVQSNPDEVVAALKLHALLDSDVHFAAALGRINSSINPEHADPGLGADMIYLLAQAFHSSWYEAMDGVISLSRRKSDRPFKPRLQSIGTASRLLRNASIERLDFRDAWRHVQTSDLVFIDPPYLADTDTRDPRAYNATRFARDDFEELVQLTQDGDLNGVGVVLCWSQEETCRLKGGRWLTIGRDAIWLSQSIIERWSIHPDGMHGDLGVNIQGQR
jgi:DNA adenine methylase